LLVNKSAAKILTMYAYTQTNISQYVTNISPLNENVHLSHYLMPHLTIFPIVLL